jgi:hypothetical protein
MSFLRKWMKLKIIVLSEISLSHKEKNHVFSHVKSSGGKHMKVEGALGMWKGKRVRWKGIRKSNRGGEDDQSTLSSCMGMS